MLYPVRVFEGEKIFKGKFLTEYQGWGAVVPTVWNGTHVLEASVGNNILMARKSGEEWYMGGMTDWNAHDVVLDLSFLTPGTYDIQYKL